MVRDVIKVALRTTCIKNVKFKTIKIRSGCQYVGYFYWTGLHKTFDWATCGPQVGHSWDRQSQTSRRGCHCWELQNEPFAFCGRFGTACVDLLNRVFSTHLNGFCCVRLSGNENQHYCKKIEVVSLKTPKAVYSASERKYTAAGGVVQVSWNGIHEWWKSEQRYWYTDW